MLDWYAGGHRDSPDVDLGFELDTSKPELPAAAAHFQPRTHAELGDGVVGKYTLTLMLQWAKARWTNGRLQPA